MAVKNYTLEFKKEAVRLVLDKGYSQIEAAHNLGIPKSCLQRWILNEKGIVVSHKTKNSFEQPAQDEIKLLRKEVEKLKLEREILKKAAAFFARENL
jgi:transposase